jgi:integrase
MLAVFVRTNARYPFLYPMFVLAAHTGAPRSELMRSRVEDFDFDSKTVVIREKKDKLVQTTYCRVLMSPLLAQVLSEWFARHPGGMYAFAGWGTPR